MIPILLLYTTLSYSIPTGLRITDVLNSFSGNSGSSQYSHMFLLEDLRTLPVGLFQTALDRMIQLTGLSVLIRFLQSSGVKNRSKVAVLVGCNESASLSQGKGVKSRGPESKWRSRMPLLRSTSREQWWCDPGMVMCVTHAIDSSSLPSK